MTQDFTKYPLASVREVASLSFSFMLVLFSGSLMGLCDRIILAHSSLQAFEASVSALYLVQLFQIPSIRIISVAQMYVSQYKGAKKDSYIGPIIWQMIWLSFILMLLILPISFPVGRIFFKNSAIQAEGISYFQYLISGNFFFTIGAALACFYLGQGKTQKVLVVSIFSQIINLLLDLAFVFGIKGWIAPMGAKGAALASVIAEAFFCFVLLKDFLKAKYRQLYGSGDFGFKRALFLQSLKLGGSRGISKLMLLLSWIATTHIILQKNQPEYLAVLAFGGSLILFVTCFHEGISRSVATIGAYIVGAKKSLIWKLARSAIYFLLIVSSMLIIPSLIFQDRIIDLFFKEEISAFLRGQLNLALYWVCLHFFLFGTNTISLGLINTYGDPKFQIPYSILIMWLTGFLPVYIGFEIFNWPPHCFWLIMALHCFAALIPYPFRLRQEKWKTKSIVPEKSLEEMFPTNE